ncbi:uncharacterized protein LOC133723232 [Rosa rugosa]|uniref:uncharacterized protein LOC133723232 n=1 Tax=Rosa rugosa TaxID=74645 RepID=UPI002B40FD0C|nr:uncharacterized protein LOC133723232 [Rosa rugosa]
MMKKSVEEEDKDSEDRCFCCYDGGGVVICEDKNCLKVYHPECVGKGKNSMDSGKCWTCSRHSCVVCSDTSRFYCLCCPHASCKDCLGGSGLALTRVPNGLCKSCLTQILRAEENSEYGLEGEKIDFEDQDELRRFKEYWEIVKEKEGLTSEDVYSAYSFLQAREYRHIGDSDETMSDSDEDSGSEDEDDVKLEHEHKKRRVSSATTIASDEKKASPRFQKSCFASIIPENMKLVYIKKSLLEKLLEDPDHSESKVLGSLVKVKNNPLDYFVNATYCPYQLSQVKGIKEISATNGESSEIQLQVSNFLQDIPLSRLSDFDLTKEECEDLSQNIADGHLKKPTVVELEKKARELHQDITKHWIENELVRLQRHIDRANEKGQREQLAEYLNQRELLEKPSEQQRLLKQMPEVIADVVDLESALNSGISLSNIERLNGSNFKKWKEHVELYLGLQGIDICLTEPQPEIDAQSDEALVAKNREWLRANRKAKLVAV